VKFCPFCGVDLDTELKEGEANQQVEGIRRSRAETLT
jgi:hypothetical protein